MPGMTDRRRAQGTRRTVNEFYIPKSKIRNRITLHSFEGVMVNLALRSSHWIVDEDGNIIVGKGRAEILANIEKTGSINQAAKVMKMSYKGVWSKIKATEKHLNQNIVYADRKEGSRLTRQGKELLEKYKQLEKKCMASDDRIFSKIFK
jgi:molybdate transport system regulatory protein